MGFLKTQFNKIDEFVGRHKFAVRALAGFAVVSALAVHAEETGYSTYNLPNGWNPVCALDPYCRKLTEDEITWAQEFFGDTIDYKAVNYFSRQMIRNDRDVLAYHYRGNIYEARNWESIADNPGAIANVFIHEMVHVWQYEVGIIPSFGPKKSEHDKTYDFDINEYETFAEYGIEQQATIVQVIAARRYRYNKLGEEYSATARNYLYNHCKELNIYEEKAAQMLPLEITDCDARFGTPTPSIPEV